MTLCPDHTWINDRGETCGNGIWRDEQGIDRCIVCGRVLEADPQQELFETHEEGT